MIESSLNYIVILPIPPTNNGNLCSYAGGIVRTLAQVKADSAKDALIGYLDKTQGATYPPARYQFVTVTGPGHKPAILPLV